MTEPLYRPHILAHARNPQYRGVVDGATHRAGEANPACGDRCRVTSKVENDVIIEARFEGVGCALSTAATSILLEEMTGKSVADIAKMTDETFLALLGVDVTSGRLDCALFGLRTLRRALCLN